MSPEELAALIEDDIDGAEAEVRRLRGSHDDDHMAVRVISETFAEHALVEQHQMVYDALGEHMTRDVHALEVSTFTPAEFQAASE
jgi:acid stress-induced BolA-like protein IbaG/YrbA